LNAPLIHPTAVIDAGAEIDADVVVGPYTVIEAGVRIESGTTVGPHVHIQGLTRIGPDNAISTGCTLGFAPQHLAYRGEPRRLRIGRGNTIREYANIHRAFEVEGETVIGDGCFIMGFSHVAHDCRIGDGAILANGALLGGHVTIGERAFVSGNVLVHQHCRIGRLAMVGGGAGIGQDVPPFVTVGGVPSMIRGLNSIGLRRAGIGAEERMELRRVFKQIYRGGTGVREAAEEIELAELPETAREFIEFVKFRSKRGPLPHASYRRMGAETEEREERMMDDF
jgi:UDP-N-acetylglucosamine acyltransferase